MSGPCGGVPAWSGVGVSGPWGVGFLPGLGVSPWSRGGVSGPGGGGVPGQVLPPVNRITDRCKNITLAKTSFRPVINS